jgi:hypothetical protein
VISYDLAASRGRSRAETKVEHREQEGVLHDLPSVHEVEIEAVVDYLLSREHSQRKPVSTAKVLVLAVKLHKDHTPWPTRPAVAKHLDVSLPLVDTAISQRRAQNMIKVVIETTQGLVKQRQSVVTHKFIEPSDELIKVVEGITVEHAANTAGMSGVLDVIEAVFEAKMSKPKRKRAKAAGAANANRRALAPLS